MEIWLVVNGGYDYQWPEVLAVCSSEDQAKDLCKSITDPVFPWNTRGYIKVSMNTLLDWDAIAQAA